MKGTTSPDSSKPKDRICQIENTGTKLANIIKHGTILVFNP